MSADFDMNSNRILNVANGVLGTDGVNLNQVTNIATLAAATAVATGGSGTGTTTGDPITLNFGVASGTDGTVSRTVFDLNGLFGVTSMLGLTVIVNGVVQIPSLAYSVSDTTTVTFTESLAADSNIMFIYGDLSPTPVLPNILADGAVSYDLAAYYPGVMGDGEIFMSFMMPRPVSWLANLSGSYGNAGVAATAQTDFDVQVDAVSVGTIRFAAAATTPTFIAASAVDITAGQLVEILGPVTADTTLADITFTIYGTITP
jgi:hypothetical protein